MNISGVTTNYSAAYDTEKVEHTGTDKNFAAEIANAAQEKGARESADLRGVDEESGDTAVFQMLYTDGGIKYSVYKPQDFNPENPVYTVKVWDAAGNVTERMIDASKIDPKNCDTFEMQVYTAHLKETGKGDFQETVLKAAVAKAVKNAEQKSSGSWNYSTNINWVETVKDIMQSVYDYGDLKGYMEWRKFLSFLE